MNTVSTREKLIINETLVTDCLYAKTSHQKHHLKTPTAGAFLGVQQLRICLAVQGCGFNPWSRN